MKRLIAYILIIMALAYICTQTTIVSQITNKLNLNSITDKFVGEIGALTETD